MPRKSKVRRLPPELRDQLHAMLDEGRTIDEITAHLKTLGADVSRSGVGRYAQQVEKVAARMRQGKEISAMLAARLGEGVDESRVGRALVQAISVMTQEYVLKRMDDPDAEMDISELRELARLARDAGVAARANQHHELKTREAARE